MALPSAFTDSASRRISSRSSSICAAVAASLAVSSSLTRCTIHDASVAVTMPIEADAADHQCHGDDPTLCGERYQIAVAAVVTVVIDHHSASPKC